MAPRQKDPDAIRHRSAFARGYRQVSMTEAQRDELRAAAHADGYQLVSDYLMMVHRFYQASKGLKD